jgi:hypothetical protein
MQDVRTLPVGEGDEIAVTHDDLAREGARRMIAAALEAEVDEYLASFVDEVGGLGRRLAVRNGHARATCSAAPTRQTHERAVDCPGQGFAKYLRIRSAPTHAA